MQMRFIDLPQLADTIEGADFAAIMDSPDGEQIHLIRFGGQDMIAIQHLGDSVTVIESDDDGLPSIHALAAQMQADKCRGT